MLPLLRCLAHHRSMIHKVLIISQAPLNIFLARMLYALSVHLVSSTGTLDLVWPLQYHSIVKPCAPPNITQGISLPALRTLRSKVSLIAVVSSIYKMYVLIHFAKLHVWMLSEHVTMMGQYLWWRSARSKWCHYDWGIKGHVNSVPRTDAATPFWVRSSIKGVFPWLVMEIWRINMNGRILTWFAE